MSEEFMNLLKEKEANVLVSENGGKGYRTTGKALLDLNFSTASLRSKDESEIIFKWNTAFAENPEYALKWLFFARDIREGMGERRLFRTILKWMANNNPKAISNLIVPKIMGEYGCWSDILILFDTYLEDTALYCIYQQLKEDISNANNNKPISLLAKWLPSINTSSSETRKKAKKIQANLLITEQGYRKMLSKLRQHLKVVERQMSENKWSEIEYDQVPSVANIKYARSFLKHDFERRHNYLTQVSKGQAKINSKDLYPYQITTNIRKILEHIRHMYRVYYDYYTEMYVRKLSEYISPDSEYLSSSQQDELNLMEGMWKNLPNLIPSASSILVIRDGSGSMLRSVEGTGRAIDIANSLTLYFAEHLKGAYHNTFITFSSKPEVVTIPDKINDLKSDQIVSATLLDKMAVLSNYDDCTNTNIEATFDLILDIAVKNHLSQDELPQNTLIVSDMEFDAVTNNPDSRVFESIESKFKAAGYKMPRLIFWNVASRTGTIPVRKNELGVSLVSGFSIHIMNMILSNKLDPYEVLLETLDSERYKQITYRE